MRAKNKPIKIAFVIDQLGPGGTELQLKLLANGLDRERFQPIIYLLHYDTSPPLKWGDTPCQMLGINSIGKVAGLMKIWLFSRVLRQEGCNVVQTFFQDSAFCGAIAGRLAGVDGILISIRDMLFWSDKLSIKPLQIAIRLSHGIVVNSLPIKRKVSSLTRKKPIQVIPNGIKTGTEYLKNPDARKRLLKEFGFDDNLPIIVTVANCNRPVKRVDLFVEAVPEVLKYEKANFLVIGDGYLRPELEKRSNELGVSNSLIFTGRRNDVPAILSGSDIYVNTSDSEGLSNSIMEAMRAGLPVIASDIEGNGELITPNQTGLSFSPGDKMALASRLLSLIENQNLRSCLGRKAADYINKNHSIDLMIKNYSILYCNYLKKA